MSKLPESARLTYARQLADEAKTLVPGMERLSAIAEELRADDLYRLLGFDTWERFCVDYLGVSKWTANRWIAGSKAKSIGAGQSVAAVQNAPVVESKALNSAKSPEGLDQAGLHRAGQRADEPSGAVSANDPPTPSGPSSGGADVQPPAGPTGEAPTSSPSAPPGPPERPPSRRQQASAIVAAFQDAEDGVGRGWTPEEATYLFARFRVERMAWATYNKATIEWVDDPPASVEKPQRRQGTITRPQGAVVAGRAIEQRSEKIDGHEDCLRPGIMPARFNSTPAPKTAAKRHALDCSCLGCKPAKAVAK